VTVTTCRPAIPSVEDSPTVSVPLAAAALGVSLSAAYGAVRRGDLPTVKIGGRRLVPTAWLRAVLYLDGVEGLIG